MVLQINKKDKESSQSLVHRFTKMVRQSGVLLELRKKQFHKKPKSALAKKLSVLRKVALKKEKIKQDKLAKPK